MFKKLKFLKSVKELTPKNKAATNLEHCSLYKLLMYELLWTKSLWSCLALTCCSKFEISSLTTHVRQLSTALLN